MSDSNPAATAEHEARRAVITLNPLVHEIEPEVFVARHRLVLTTPVSADADAVLQGATYVPMTGLVHDSDRRDALAGLLGSAGLALYEGMPEQPDFRTAEVLIAELRALSSPVKVDFVPYLTLAPHDMGPSGPPSESLAPAHDARPPGMRPVVIAVLDTGLPANWKAFHPGNAVVADLVAGDPTPDRLYTAPLDLDEPGAVGHGLFVATIAGRSTPQSVEVRVYRCSEFFPYEPLTTLLSAADIAGDLALAQRCGRADRPLIVNMSFGGYYASNIQIDLLGLLLKAILLTDPGTVFCCAAGNKANFDPPPGDPGYNDGTRQIHPAAYSLDVDLADNVVAVGAVDRRGNVAPFSGRGPWVNAWALGVGVVSEYVPGRWTTTQKAPLPQIVARFPLIAPAAAWSGTSFATPHVAAAIARGCVETGRSPQTVWAEMRRTLQRDPTWTDKDGDNHVEVGVIVP